MRQIIFSFTFLVLVVMGFANVANAQFTSNNRRAINLGMCVSQSELTGLYPGIQIPEAYTDDNSLNGMSLGSKTPAEVGWNTIAVWNEIPGNPNSKDVTKRSDRFCLTLLATESRVRTLNGDKAPVWGYLEGCTKNGKPYKNRIIVPPVQVTTLDCKSQPGSTRKQMPDGRFATVTTDATCHESVVYDAEKCASQPGSVRKQMPDGKLATVTTDANCHESVVYDVEVRFQNTCPTIDDAAYASKGWTNRLPSIGEWILGPGKAVLIAGLGSNQDRGKAVLIAGSASTIDTVAVNWFYPDFNVLNLDTSVGQMTVQKGKAPFTLQTAEFGILTLAWTKDSQISLRSSKGICFAGAVQKGFQTGSDAIVFRGGGRDSNVSQTIPIKHQTTTPVGQGRLNGGTCLPGGPVHCTIISSVPTRPTASNPNPGGSSPILTQTSTGIRPFVDGEIPQNQNYSRSSGTATKPVSACDSEPGAICRNVIQADGTIIRMRVN